MKYHILLIISLFVATVCNAQLSSLNQGGTNQKDYFSIIKFENYHGFIMVSAKIKGEIYRFLLDTGAPNCISKALQQKLNFKILNKMPVSDSNNSTDTMTIVSMDALEFGGVTFNHIPALITDSPVLIDCMKVDGIIGSNMLRNSIIRFSYSDTTIVLTDNIKKLNLSKKHASKMMLDLAQSNPYIRVKLIGKKMGKEQLLFDTGKRGFYDMADRNYTKVFNKYPIFTVESKGYGRSSMGIHGNGRDMHLYRLVLPQMVINGTSFQNILTETSTDDNSKIGHDILKFGNVTLDYKNKAFYFEPFKNNVDLIERKFPISLRINDNQLFIGIVWDSTLNTTVQIGDQVIAVDDVNYERVTMCEIFTKESFAGKERAKLTIKDKNGVVKEIVIQKK